MSNTDPRVDAYIEKAAPFAKPVLMKLRKLIFQACPEARETIKWSFPNYEVYGSVFCNMAAFKEHCAFGFWKASLLEDPDNILTVTDRHSMGHLNKITSLKDLPKDALLKKYIKAAMKLNETGVKTPARKKPTEKEKHALDTPTYFTKALKKNKAAERVFNEFSYSNKKEYIEWLEEAKTDATRDKRMAQAVEWIGEGKSRNWKYKNC